MAVTSFDCNKNLQLTKNFNIKEFKCKGTGHIHNTLIDTDFVKMLQDFMNKNGYTKAIISSAYRCPEHNKSVGGSGSSTHTQGRAVDICFYKGNEKVPAKEVCCKAQDYGFKGIAYIDKYHVHLDNRVNGTYRGDETKGYSNNVPNGDFYKYFGISNDKKETYQGEFPKLPLRGYFKKGDKGTQVKNLQNLLNWANNSKNNVDGIIGNKTIEQVKIFEKENGLKVDGKFGKNCLEKAKKIKK